MPELLPHWEHLVELSGGDEQVARMLSVYRPTPLLAGCSQAVWSRTRPMLVRNYDYHPDACEGTFLASAWNPVRVMVQLGHERVEIGWVVITGASNDGTPDYAERTPTTGSPACSSRASISAFIAMARSVRVAARSSGSASRS